MSQSIHFKKKIFGITKYSYPEYIHIYTLTTSRSRLSGKEGEDIDCLRIYVGIASKHARG